MGRKILLERKKIGCIPVVECRAEDAQNAPLVLLNHGTGGNGLQMLEMGMRLAEKGCFCVLIDAVWHGERSDDKLRVMLETSLYKEYYLDMLLLMAEDMSRLIDYYGDSKIADASRVGMSGISQGGYVAFMTMTRDSRIRAAAPIIGSPDLSDKYGNSMDWEDTDPTVRERVLKEMPLSHYEKMAGTALLIQNSMDDTVVPVTGTRRLNEKLRPLYKDRSGDYKYIEYKGGHWCNDQMMSSAVEWLSEKLA